MSHTVQTDVARTHVTPERIMQIAWGHGPVATLTAGLELRVFTLIAEGATTLKQLHQETKASERGLPMLLNALVGLGFLIRHGAAESAHYSLSPDADAFLVEGKPPYLGDFIRLAHRKLSQDWYQLTDCIRTGKPMIALDKPGEAASFWDELVDAIMAMNFKSSSELANELTRLHPKAKVLDVAAGSGVWGLAVARRNPDARIVAFDLETTLPHVRRNAERFGLAKQVELRAGDIRTSDLGNAEFDAVILGHICHSEGAEHTQKLFAKIARALKPGGTIAVPEFVPNDERSGPPMPLLFALNMLIHSAEGDTFTYAEYSSWLKSAGFRDVRAFDASAVSPLILATRA